MVKAFRIDGSTPYQGKASSRAGRVPQRLNLHHWGGFSGGEERMADPYAQVSCNILNFTNGVLKVNVPFELSAWTSNSWEADSVALTMETQNNGGQVNGNDQDPNSWTVSSLARENIVSTLVYMYYTYGWDSMDRSRLVGHRELGTNPTACPGGYLMSQIPLLVSEAADAILGTTKPTRKKETEMAQNVGVLTPSKSKKAGLFDAAYFNLETGEVHQVTEVTESYARNVAKTYGCDVPSSIYPSHFDQILKDLAATRARLSARAV